MTPLRSRRSGSRRFHTGHPGAFGTRRLVASFTALVCGTATLAVGALPAAGEVAADRVTTDRVTTGRVTAGPVAAPGTDLLVNSGAQAGTASAQGWDSVTIPGWQVASGLPTVVRYGTHGFPAATGRWPAVRGGQLFAGGAGGTARLRQLIRPRQPDGTLLPSGTRYHLSAWLGRTHNSKATVTVAFASAAGRVLGRRTIGPAAPGFTRAAASGVLPAGTAGARVTLVLATSLTNIDGPGAPRVGYDRAVADGLRLSVSARVRRPPPLTPPRAHVPRYQHVFLFYFENEDFGSVIGNTGRAPYLNGLLPHASLLANFFAEEHPSDGNYLALAGGSTFGIPLTDPLEENPRYTIRARNIGDLVDAAHETWKAYLQSANGPCDDTVHGYYWNDDLPMAYFADVRDRPAYCSAHLVPLQSLRTDLASAATTPSFAWVGPNDCTDMEGCGIRSGDAFLATQLGEIMRSPAWRTQRSLAIITFDEDGYDHEHPAQRVATLLLGSAGVRQGYVSHVRYTHYSLLRTIEAALSLGELTSNDRYAQPVNDVFRHRPGPTAVSRSTLPPGGSPPGVVPPGAGSLAVQPPLSRARAPLPRAPLPPARAPLSPARAAPPRTHGPTAFVVNSGSGTVTPVDLAARQAEPPIKVGADPQAIAVTPDGRTAYVANAGSGTVTPINTTTRRPGTPIKVGAAPRAIAITPGGRTAYVANAGSGTVTPINTATNRPGPPIKVGASPRAITITPDGRTAYVLDWGGAAVTPVSTATGRADRPIRVGSYPFAMTIAPGGRTAYVASYGSNTVTPITVATGRPGRAIAVGQAPDALAVTPDGRTVYVAGGDSDALTPIVTAHGRPGHAIPVGYSPAAIAMSRSGATAYVVNTISGTVTPVSTRTGRAGQPITVGRYSYPLAITLAPAGSTAVVAETYAGRAAIVNTRTRRTIAKVKTGGYPVAVAITG
jgi:YVTN family beta-propeller protein